MTQEKKKILFLEDYKDLTGAFIDVMEVLFPGIEVVHYKNAEDFLENNKGENFDLIVSDYNMGDKNGIDLHDMLKTDDKYKNTPFCLFSMSDDIVMDFREKEGNKGFIKSRENSRLFLFMSDILGIVPNNIDMIRKNAEKEKEEVDKEENSRKAFKKFVNNQTASRNLPKNTL